MADDNNSNDTRMPNSTDLRWPPGRRRWSDFLEVLLFMLLLVSATRAMCPYRCVCDDKLLKAGCQNSSLEVVPIQLNPDIKHLDLNSNRISSVHMTFTFYTNLNELDLSFNKIKTLGSKNFEFQMNLIKLNVSNNAIKQLHKDSFKGLKNLSVLDLSNNLIEEINDRTSFKDLSNLQILDLSKNNIFMIETGVFDYLIDLKRLILNDNQLMKIPDNSINTLNNLVEINLNLNLIDELSFPSNLGNLEVLKLRSNLLSSLSNETFGHLRHLKYLDLSDNNFTQVPTLQFSRLSYLEHLNLSANLFRYLGPNSFRNMYRLTEVFIDDVATLSKVDSKLFLENVNLDYISLSNNVNLKYLPKFLFLNKPKLKHIRISGNDFSTLDASDLPLDQLETLRLGQNPFQCNCSLLWLWILKEKQVVHNCTCNDASCFETCLETSPKSDRLDAGEYDESDGDDRRRNALLNGLPYSREMLPIILDLDEVYCEDLQNSVRVPFKNSPKSVFDCTMTWVLIVTVAVLVTLFALLLSVAVYIFNLRCRRKARNPVEGFITATKNYEDTHHTYYRYGQNLQSLQNLQNLHGLQDKNGDVYHDKCGTNMYIKTPILNYPYSVNTFKSVDNDVGLNKAYKKHFSGSNMADPYADAPNLAVKNYVSETNIYQEPFVGPILTKNQRPPHIVYV